MIKIAGIYREKQFSNRAVDADRAIMDEVLSSLNQKMNDRTEISVFQAGESLNLSHLEGYDCILSMAQDEKILIRLRDMERNGVTVLNSITSIRNCSRVKLSGILKRGNLSYPDYIVLDTSDKIPQNLPFSTGFWVKRGDFHALQDNDVQFVADAAALVREMKGYAARGITQVVCQKNIAGHIIKFYGIANRFFSYRYMGMTGPDRYHLPTGHEPDNLDLDLIKDNAFSAAQRLGLVIYGGDCIVDTQGKLHFIDVNDWPSFRTCADEAAHALSDYIIDLFTGFSIAL